MTTRMIIDAHKLKIALAQADLDQNKAAAKAGLSYPTVSRFKGSDNWQPRKLAALADALGVHPFDLLTVTQEPQP